MTAGSWLAVQAGVALLPASAAAQGSGPPQGMEALLYAFIAFAAVFVLVVSIVLFALAKKAFFKDRAPTLSEKVVLFGVSVFASIMLGVLLMFVLDIR